MKKYILRFALGASLVVGMTGFISATDRAPVVQEAEAAGCGVSFPYYLCPGWTYFTGTGQTALAFYVNALCWNAGNEVLYRWNGSAWVVPPWAYVLSPAQGYWVYCPN